MFKTKKVACYLNGFGGHGDDQENKELKLVFHINPIVQELAAEISPLLSDRLFRKEGDEWVPAKEITKVSFSSVQVQMQNIEFHELPDADRDQGVLVEAAAISNLRASRAFAESENFRLEFDVVIPMDGITMRLVEKYYKSTAFLTMEGIQRQIDLDEKDESHAETEQLLQGAADDEEPETVGAGSGKKRGRRRGKDAAAGKD